ncbi:hypothetical protein [Streptomyces sp. NPDC055006]
MRHNEEIDRIKGVTTELEDGYLRFLLDATTPGRVNKVYKIRHGDAMRLLSQLKEAFSAVPAAELDASLEANMNARKKELGL